jgi:uncharacterized iron-regulated protein
MTLAFAACATLLAAGQLKDADPQRLDIGESGVVTVSPGQIVETSDHKVRTADQLAKAAANYDYFYIGEQHATTAHQQMEADMLHALANERRRVVVGFEMLTRPKQDALDAWSLGSLSEAQFLDQSDWGRQWGFDYAFYRPVFEAVKELHAPAVALNVPRDWVHAVSRTGFAGLPTSAKIQLPVQLYLGNREHRKVFDALMGGHEMQGVTMDNLYEAQVLWDEGMADTALKYIERSPNDPSNIFVVIAGAGHVLYKQGINFRVERRHGGRGLTLVMIESDTPVTVSRSIADYVFVSPKGH